MPMINRLAAEITINLLLGFMFTWIGYLIHYKKQYQLIAGYNVLTEELQKRVDIIRYSKHIKNACVYMGIMIALLPSVLRIAGIAGWGLSFPLIFLSGSIYSVVAFFACFQWKLNGNNTLR